MLYELTETEPSAEGLPGEERRALAWAHRHLEHPSFAIWLSSVLGAPIEQSLGVLPGFWQRRLRGAAETSIHRALDLAIGSLQRPMPRWSRGPLHRTTVALSGAASGFLGPLGLVADLPLTTTIMLRSIAGIAGEEGEDLSMPETRFACLQVFALGGRTREDDAAETGYYGMRLALGLHFPGAIHLGGAVSHVPYAIELVRAIASRFGVVISQHAAVRMIPVAGALGGASLNVLFLRHFENVARGHFTVRRLERLYGEETVRRAYEHLSRAERAGH